MERDPKPGLRVQERDAALFSGLLESRVMTREQLAGLYFGGNYEVAKKRLAKLTREGFLAERRPEANPGHFYPALLSLGRRGFEALKGTPTLAPFAEMTWEDLVGRVELARSTLAHEIELVELRLALAAAARTKGGIAVDEFLTWPLLFQFATEDRETRKAFVLKPDAFVLLSEGDELEHSLFVEHDRSTEAGRQLMRKAWGYHHFFTGGGYARRCGAAKEAFKEYPFRVCYVFPTIERRNAIAERLLQVTTDDRARTPALYKEQHWLTTRAEFLGDPLGPIWLTLGAYWRATEGTLYDPRRHTTTMRLSARDRLIATRAALTQLVTKEVSHG